MTSSLCCNWCSFELKNIRKDFKGYGIYDSRGLSLSYTFCSLNCAVAQIQAMDVDVYSRIDYILNIYNIRGYINPALPSSKLMKFGGKISYEEYRRHFTCPNETSIVDYKEIKDKEYIYSTYQLEEDNDYEMYIANEKEDVNHFEEDEDIE